MPAGAVTLADILSADWSLALDLPGQSGSGIGNVVEGLNDISQCIQIILTTPKGTDPLRPTFGSDLWQFIDYPINAAIPHMVREVFEAIEIWEPRVNLLSVNIAPVIDSTAQSGAHLTITSTWQVKLAAPLAPADLQQQTTVVTVPISSIANAK